MYKIGKRTVCALLALVLLIIVLLVGRPLLSGDTPPSTADASQEESIRAEYEQFEERRITAQKEFTELTENLFREEIRTSQLDLHFLLKNPGSYGIDAAKSLYAPVTLEELQKSTAEQKALAEQLNQFDPALLTYNQKLTLQILQSFLRTEAAADGLEMYYQPLATTIGVQAQLPILLCEYAFYQKQDIDDYLRLLDGIDEYYGQILEFEKQKAEAGLMMSDTSLNHVIESCESYLLLPDDNFLIDTFNSRLESVPGLTDEEKETYRRKNAELLETSFVPAYQLLIDGLNSLKGTGTNETGLCGYPDGKKYYRYLVYSHTGTSYDSISDLLDAVEKSLDGYLMETTKLLKSNPQLAEQFDSYQFRQTEPGAIMEELKTQCLTEYPALPACNYTFKDVPQALELSLSPAFYVTSPLDDYQNNVIYINRNPRFENDRLYPTIAHEGYPGHLYQNVYFHTNCGSNLRKLLSFPGFSEGWATYVEYHSYALDNGLDPEMAQMLSANSMASLGLHACLDIYINYEGWDKKKVRYYLANFYSEPDAVLDDIYSAMVENPGNYLSYYVGCMELEAMRETAQKELGRKFDVQAFHKFLLDIGDAPFDVIQVYFSSWLAEQKL